MFGFQSIQGIHILIGQFERQVLLQLHAFSRQVAHEESVINMKQAAIFLDHDVSIVSVLDLQEVSHQAISRERVDEVFALGLGIEDGLDGLAFFLQLVDGDRISHAFHNA